ncbi:MAG: hypothetical protein IJZ04_02455 [Clostridia bacterium]|nr:hypothetical protein [Clostridia bacterium]
MRTPQEFKRSEERLVGGSHACDRRESQFGMRNGTNANAECGIRSSDERTPQEHEPWRSVIGWWKPCMRPKGVAMVLSQARYVPSGLDMFRYAQLDMDSASPRYAASLRWIAYQGTWGKFK